MENENKTILSSINEAEETAASTAVPLPETENKASATEALETAAKKKSIKLIAICTTTVVIIAAIAVAVPFLVKGFRVKSELQNLSTITVSYESGEMNYADAVAYVKTLIDEKNDQRIKDSAKEVQKKLEEMKTPTEAYFSGMESEKEGKFVEAVTSFKKVTQKSLNYEEAQKHISELEEKVKEELEIAADSYAEKKDYDKAISTLESYATLYLNSASSVFGAKISNLKTEKTKYLAEKKAEEEKRKAEQTQKEKENAQAALRISRCWVGERDSAGGYPLYINWQNKSSKTVKYFTFGVTFYDPVGEPIYTRRIDNIEYCEDVGPYAPGTGMNNTGDYWGKYYDSIIDHPEIVYVEVEYMDGTSWLLNKNEIAAVQY